MSLKFILLQKCSLQNLFRAPAGSCCEVCLGISPIQSHVARYIMADLPSVTPGLDVEALPAVTWVHLSSCLRIPEHEAIHDLSTNAARIAAAASGEYVPPPSDEYVSREAHRQSCWIAACECPRNKNCVHFYVYVILLHIPPNYWCFCICQSFSPSEGCNRALIC